MARAIRHLLTPKLVVCALFFALDVSLLFGLSTAVLEGVCSLDPLLASFAFVLIATLPFLVGKTLEAYSLRCIVAPQNQPGTGLFIKRTGLGLVYALALLVVFCVICATVGLLASVFIAPDAGIVAARNFVMGCVQLLGVLAAPIPVMLAAHYALTKRRTYPPSALADFSPFAWVFLFVSFLFCFSFGWVFYLLLPTSLSGFGLLLAQILLSSFFGTLWLISGMCICVFFFLDKDVLNANLRININPFTKRMHTLGRGAIACFLSVVLAFGLVHTQAIAYGLEAAQDVIADIESSVQDVASSNTDAADVQEDINHQESSSSQILEDSSTSDDEASTEQDDTATQSSEDSAAISAKDTSSSEAKLDSEEAESSTEATEESPEPNEPIDYYEIEDEREGRAVAIEDNAITYQLDDNHFETVIGGVEDVYLDENNQICEVDNTLLPVLDEPDIKYENAANHFSAQVPAQMDGQSQGISFTTQDGYTLEIVPLDGDFSVSTAKDNAIRFSAVRENIDYQYSLVGSLVKEDIVLGAPVERQAFKSLLRLPEGLDVYEQEGSVYVCNEAGEEVLLLSAPVMIDATGEESTNVGLSLLKSRDGPIIHVEPDWEWIEDAERVYPIRIDPTISITNPKLRVTAVHSNAPETITAQTPYLACGYDDGVATGSSAFFYVNGQPSGHGMYRIYAHIDYDFTKINDDAQITSATFSLHQRRTYSDGKTKFLLCKVDNAWSFANFSWNTQKNFSFSTIDTATARKSNGYIDFDISLAVKEWAAGKKQRGLCLKAQDERGMQCEMFSNIDTSTPPKISIKWKIPNEVDEDYSLNKTTVNLRPMTERNVNGGASFDGVFADGLAKPSSSVVWVLDPTTRHGEQEASASAKYPDSTTFEKLFPRANTYHDKVSNWQTGLFTNLAKDKIYRIDATASLDGRTGKTAKSDTFLVYTVKRMDTLPYIAKHYGVKLKTIAVDNRVSDMLVVPGDTLFIRNPKKSKPYSTKKKLTITQKKKIDSALMGRDKRCKYGFEPINFNTGNFLLEQVDATVPEVEGDFTLARTYNSMADTAAASFGEGWSFAYDESITRLEDGSLVLTEGDGKVFYFQGSGGTYTCPENSFLTLKSIKQKDGTYTYELSSTDGTSKQYNAWGMLTSIKSALGLVTKIERNEDMLISAVVSPSGYRYDLTYNADGFVSKVRLPDSSTVYYAYNDDGRLTSYTDATGAKISYAYNQSGLLSSWRDADGNLVCENIYDSQGRVTTQKDALGNVSSLRYGQNSTTTTDALGNETVYTYDSFMRTTSVAYSDGYTVTSAWDGAGNLIEDEGWTYSYDASGNMTSQTSPDGITTTFAYDAKNRLIQIIHPDGEVVDNTYSAQGDLVKIVSSSGTTTTNTYDAAHRLVSSFDADGVGSTFAYSGAWPIRATNAAGQVSTYTYDKMGRTTSATNGAGNTEYTSYDAAGRIVSQTDGAGGKTSYGLSKAGLVRSITDPRGNTTHFSYDAAGNMVGATDPAGGKYSFTFDALGRQTSTTSAAGAKTNYTYDVYGRLASSTDPLGNTTSYAYDNRSNLISTTYPDGASHTSDFDETFGVELSSTNELGATTYASYTSRGDIEQEKDALSNITRHTYKPGRILTSTTDALGNTTSYTYTQAGRIASIDKSGQITALDYDKAGNIAQITDAAGGVHSFSYDGAGRTTKYTDPEGRSQQFSYDGAGRIVSQTDGEGNTQRYAYDAAGNMVGQIDELGNATNFAFDVLGQLIATTDALGNTQSFVYDAAGNVITETDKLGASTNYVFDAAGNMTSFSDAAGNTWAYSYDVRNRAVEVTLPTGVHETANYDAAGNMISLVDAAGLEFKMQYDAAGHMVGIEDSFGAKESYVYDALGNVVEETDSLERQARYTYDAWQNVTEEFGFDGYSSSFEYDALGNVITETNAQGASTHYVYDGSGNLVSITDALNNTDLYTYDKANRLTDTTDALGNKTTYAYDAASNIVSYTDEDAHTTTYSYDALSRLVKQINPLGAATAYSYDEVGNVVSITRPEGDASNYAYDVLGNLVSYTDGTGATSRAVYDAFGNVVETFDALGARTLYTYDAHQALLSETDDAGNETRYEVDLHGNTTVLIKANSARYTYEYDVADRLISLTTPLGYKRDIEYDAAGDVVRESDNLGREQTYALDKLHNLVSLTDAKGARSNYEYDALGNLIGTTDALGAKTNLAYDALGRLTSLTDAKGGQTKYAYDGRGNITGITTPAGRNKLYTYDGASNLIQEADGLGQKTSYTYDKNDRLVGITTPRGAKSSFSYDAADNITSATNPLGHATRYTYDAVGNLVSVSDPAGNISCYSYDSLGQLVESVLPSGAATKYAYDEVGNLSSMQDARGNTTCFSYDKEGNLVSKQSPQGSLLQIEYDLAGRMQAVTNPAGQTTNYRLDEINNLVEKSYTGSIKAGAVTYTRDALGQVTVRKDDLGQASFTYDELGRLISERDAAGNTIIYSYDADSNLESLTYPDGTKVVYSYDEADNLVSIEALDGIYNYEYDVDNNPTSLSRPDGSTTTYSYNDAGQIILLENKDAVGKTISKYAYTYSETGDIVKEAVQETDAQGKLLSSQRTYAYNEDGRLSTFKESSDLGTVEQNYIYDANGNRIQEVRLADGKREEINYSYDADNKLTQAKSSLSGTTEYAYDAAGRLVSKKGAGQEEITYEYSVEDRLMAVKEGGRLVMAATYDGDSNRVFQTTRHRSITALPADGSKTSSESSTGSALPKTSDVTTLITFGFAMGAVSALGLGSPAAVASGANAVSALFFPLSLYGGEFPISDKELESYALQALHEGWKDTPYEQLSIETSFESIAYVNSSVIDGVTQVVSQSSSFTGPSNHLYGLSRLASLHGSLATYLLADGRGSTTAAIQDGTVAASYSWGAYGELLRGTYTESPFYGYNSEEYSPATGLSYLRARYLHVSEAVFGVEDSYWGSAFEPQSLNLYAYVQGNPVRYSDPTGHAPRQAVPYILLNITRQTGATIGRESLNARNRLILNKYGPVNPSTIGQPTPFQKKIEDARQKNNQNRLYCDYASRFTVKKNPNPVMKQGNWKVENKTSRENKKQSVLQSLAAGLVATDLFKKTMQVEYYRYTGKYFASSRVSDAEKIGFIKDVNIGKSSLKGLSSLSRTAGLVGALATVGFAGYDGYQRQQEYIKTNSGLMPDEQLVSYASTEFMLGAIESAIGITPQLSDKVHYVLYKHQFFGSTIDVALKELDYKTNQRMRRMNEETGLYAGF